ncbi:MAG: hypothetical protein VB860_02865 [Dehalococcoidia bacterium]
MTDVEELEAFGGDALIDFLATASNGMYVASPGRATDPVITFGL